MLEHLDLSLKLRKKEFKARMDKLQPKLFLIQRLSRAARIPAVVVFEGWDASGKGTAISSLTERMDPRGFKVHPSSAPTEEELLRPFLWRYWIKLPARNEMSIFDRSWYGRVLVEKVDELVAPQQVAEAYKEIVQFERQLVDDGHVIVKYWLHMDKKTQKERFKACEKDPFLQWKIEPEDWRHHKQYDQYLDAVEMMLQETSTAWAPWTLIEAANGYWAQAKVFETLIRAIEERLKQIRPDLISANSEELAALSA